MAQLVLGAAGAVAGYYLSGGNPYGAQAGFAAGAALGGAYEMSKKRIEGPRISDLKAPGTEYGDPIVWMIGNQRVPGSIWWASDKREVSTTTREGKGGGPKVTTFTYEIDVLIGINEEDGNGTRLVDISRIWSFGKLVRNRLTGADADTLSNVFREDLWRRLTVYTGHPDQLPDPTYEAAVGVGNAPAYRGRGTVFIEGLQLDGSGQLPLLTFEALTSAASSIESASLTDVEIARAEYFTAGTIAINNDDTDEYVIAIGAWDGGYSTTVVNVYRISLVQTFVNGHGFGSFVTPVTSAGTFNVSAAAVTAGHGNSDEPLLVQNEGSSTEVAVYTVPAGARVAYTVGENLGASQVRFVKRGDYLVFGSTGFGAKRLRLFTFGVGAQVAQSAVMTDFVNGLAIVGDYLYAATKSTKEVYKLDLATMTLQATIQRPSYSVGAAPDEWAMLTTVNEQLMLIGNDTGAGVHKAWTLNADGTTWTQLAGTIAADDVQTSDRCQSIGVVGSLLVSGFNPGTSSFYQTWTAPITLTAAPATLQQTVEALCARAGLDSSQYDASGLATITTPVRSAAMTQVEGVRGLLEQLRAVHGFECVLSDKLYFRPRGAATVVTIPYADLGAGEEAAADEPLPITVAADLELPPQISVQFFNASNDYQTGTEFSDRLVLSSQVATQKVQFGLAMTPAEAKAVADRLNAEAAMSLVTTTLALPMAYAYLEPGDAVAPTTADGEALRFRLGRKTDAGGVMTFEAVRDDASTQTTAGETDDDYTEGSTVAKPSPTLWQLLDIPLLRDADDVPGWLAAAKGVSTTWPGAQIQVSSNGTDFDVGATINESAVFGVCTTTLADFDGGSATFDETNTLTVNVGFGELASSTRDAVLNDNTINALRVGSEIIRFVTATQTGTEPNIYKLSRLLRGQLGTEWAMGDHGADEDCTLLRPQGLRNITTQAADIGQLRYVKGVTLGTSAAGVTADEFTDTAVKLKPYAPAHLRALVAASGLVTCTWERRTRYAYRWPSESAVPLGEASEAYEVDVLTPEVAGTDAWDSGAMDADFALSGSDRIATIIAADGTVRSVQGWDAGDHVYAEIAYSGPDGRSMPGLIKSTASLAGFPGDAAGSFGYFGANGQKYTGGSGTAYGATHGDTDVIGIEMNAGTATFWKKVAGVMVSQGAAFTGLSGTYYVAWGPASSAAGTRAANVNLGQDPFTSGYPSAARAWGADPAEVIATIETTEATTDISAAERDGTLPVAAVRLTLIGSTYYGVDVEGNLSSATVLRRLVAQTAGGVVAQSPYIGQTLIDAVYTATNAYTAAYFVTSPYNVISTTEVRRFALSDITTTAATYTASVAGDVKGIAHDGSDLWVLEADTPRLRRLNGSALTVSATHSLGGPVGGGLAFSGGDLFYVDSDDIVSLDATGLTENWRTALPSGYYATKDILVADGNVFVSTWFGVCVYNAASGALVTETGLVAEADGGSLTTMAPFGSDVAIYLGPTAEQKFVILDGATGTTAAAFDADASRVLGSDSTRVWLAAQSGPSVVGVDVAHGYLPVGASLSGYKVRVYQMSATVGRGYPAEVTIP